MDGERLPPLPPTTPPAAATPGTAAPRLMQQMAGAQQRNIKLGCLPSLPSPVYKVSRFT